MGTIVERKRKDGSLAYYAQISIMREGKSILRESRTFDRRPAANAWIKKRERELEKPGALVSAKSSKRNATLGDAIQRYIQEDQRKSGRTKAQVLKTITTYNIADIVCAELRSQDIVEFAQELMQTRHMKPQTVSNYLSHLAAVLSIARPAWGYDINPQIMTDARAVTKRLGITRKSHQRDRRPSLEEIDQLMAFFINRQQLSPKSNPMHILITFALFSTRRLEEITRITWADLDKDGKRVLVRNMKDPDKKEGNNIWCDLPDPSLKIIDTMPRVANEIFPFNAKTLSSTFTQACHLLGINDLHFHDLRHEGVSRLFEMGLNIPHVASVSGHRSWTSLKRYTHIRQTGDKYEGWSWLERICSL